MHATDIIGYTYAADIICPSCLRKVAAIENEANGNNAEFTPLDTLLARWAKRDGIDRQDEHSYDSDDFPKVIFASSEDNDWCGTCHNRIDGNVACKPCTEHGVFRCRETVGTCDHCKVYKDVFAEMRYADDDDAIGEPIDTVCLDCLCTGQHMKNAHDFASLIPTKEG